MSEAPPAAPRWPKPPASMQDFVKKGLARFDLQDPYYFAVSLNWKHFTLLFLAAELSLNTVFAALYMLQPGAIANASRPDFLSAFFFSLETLATVGYGEMYPGSTYGHVISGLEIVVGMAFTAIMTGLLLIRFSRPKAKILYADNPVVASHNGKRTLMLRVGNARLTMLSSAEFSLYLLVRTVTEEGIAHASMAELPLQRGTLPLFAILFTMMHVIDETSPFAAYHGEHEELADLLLFVSVRAYDPAIGQTVADARTYRGSDIRFDMRYADAVSLDENEKVVADYSRIGAMVADVRQPDRSKPGNLV